MLFELIARRYETRSIAIAANQPFSAWGRIFPDKAVTVAAIAVRRAGRPLDGRLRRLTVHHATILEMTGDSYRRRAAAEQQGVEAVAPTTTSSDDLDHPNTDNLQEDTTR